MPETAAGHLAIDQVLLRQVLKRPVVLAVLAATSVDQRGARRFVQRHADALAQVTVADFNRHGPIRLDGHDARQLAHVIRQRREGK